MITLGVVFRPEVEPERLAAAARAAEEAGIDELWLWEDCFKHGGIASAAAVLAWTRRLRVGIGVLPVPLRNPALAAMEVTTLARLFPGRVEVGFGHGVSEWMEQVGARVESPMTLLREHLTVLRALLDGDRVTIEGRYVRLTDVQLDWPPLERLSLHVAAKGPKTCALAGELGDGLVLTASTPPDAVRAARVIFDAARAERAGRVTAYLDTIPREVGTEADTGDWGVAGDPAAVASAARRWAAAGADVVVLVPPTEADPAEFARFSGRVRESLG